MKIQRRNQAIHELIQRDQWVGLLLTGQQPSGKAEKKMPIDVMTGLAAAYNHRSTWASYEMARAAV